MKKILLIEDNEDSSYLMRFLFEMKGFKVQTARNGEEGLNKATKAHFDLIILDIRLPDTSGEEICRILRKNSPNSRTPIVALTAHAMPEDQPRILSAGATKYIQKPIEPATFLESITPLMNRVNRNI